MMDTFGVGNLEPRAASSRFPLLLLLSLLFFLAFLMLVSIDGDDDVGFQSFSHGRLSEVRSRTLYGKEEERKES